MSFVLDSSAVLALLYNEPGNDVVMRHARGAHLLSVNLSEILTRVIDKEGDPQATRALIDRLNINIARFDEPLATLAAMLRYETRQVGASLGDRACLAYTRTVGLPVLTADQKWGLLDIGIDIRMIR